MRVRYDPEVDALYVRLSETPVIESEEVAPGIILDFNQEDRLVGIEILNASKNVASDPILAAAE